jgi:hypothetical protein
MATRMPHPMEGRGLSAQSGKGGLSGARLMIYNRARELDIAINELSRKVEMNNAYMHQYLYRGTPKVLPEHVRKSVAAVLGLREEDLREDVPRRRSVAADAGLERHPAPMQPALGMRGPVNLPVLPARPVGVKGAVLPMGEQREVLPRPVDLIGAAGAFATRITTEALEPRYNAGDVLYFHPGVMPRPGDGVMIETTEGARWAGLLRSVDDTKIVLETLNPKRSQSFAIDTIALVAREVGVRRA